MDKSLFKPSLTRNIKLLTLFNFFNALRFYAAIIIIYFAQITGSYALAIAIFSVVQISQAIFEVPAGIYSDKYGRKSTVIMGTFLSILAIALYASGISYTLLIIGAILTGASNAFFSGNNDALLYETLSQTNQEASYDKRLGNIYSIEATARLISVLIGGIIATWSFPLLLWLSIIPQVICLLCGLSLKEPAIQTDVNDNVYSHLKEAFSLFKTNIQLRRLSLADIITFGVGESMYRFETVFYNTLLPVWLISIMSTIGSILGIFAFKLSGRVISKFKAINVVMTQEITRRTVYIFSLLFPTILSPILMTLSSLGYGISEVAKNSLLQKEFTNKQRSTMASINSLFGSLCYAIVALPLGVLADSLGIAKALLIGQIFILPAILLYLKIFLSSKKRGDGHKIND